jgi:hypothetical protein
MHTLRAVTKKSVHGTKSRSFSSTCGSAGNAFRHRQGRAFRYNDEFPDLSAATTTTTTRTGTRSTHAEEFFTLEEDQDAFPPLHENFPARMSLDLRRQTSEEARIAFVAAMDGSADLENDDYDEREDEEDDDQSSLQYLMDLGFQRTQVTEVLRRLSGLPASVRFECAVEELLSAAD